MVSILKKIQQYDTLEREYKNQVIECGVKERKYLQLKKCFNELEDKQEELLELLREKDLEIAKLKAPKKRGRPKKVGTTDGR